MEASAAAGGLGPAGVPEPAGGSAVILATTATATKTMHRPATAAAATTTSRTTGRIRNQERPRGHPEAACRESRDRIEAASRKSRVRRGYGERCVMGSSLSQ